MSYTPNVYDWWLHEGRSVRGTWYPGVERRYRWRGGNKPRAIFVHIQEGVNFGSWQHFHTVKASSTVLIGKNGDIWRLVPETDSPWTNGDTCNPTARGRTLLNTYGWDANVYALTIETEGFHYEWPKNARQIASVVWQIREWMRRYDIPLSMVFRHADVNQCSRPNCPGNAFYNHVMQMLRENTPLMGDAPSAPSTPSTVYAEPQVPMVDGEPWDGEENATINDVVFHADRQTVEVAVDTLNCRQWASTTSELVRAALRKGNTFEVLGWVNGEAVDGEARWWVTPHGTRVWVGGTVQQPSEERPDDAPDSDGKPYTPFVVNGHLFYPVGPESQGRPIDVLVNANLRQYASTESKIIGSAAAGTTLTARFWTRGEEIDGEDIWWVIDRGEKNVLLGGARLSATLTDSRPR